MNILEIPSMANLFDYTPTPSAAKNDKVLIIDIADSVWPKLLDNLSKDLGLYLSKEGKSLYKGQKRVVTVLTNIDPGHGAAPMA